MKRVKRLALLAAGLVAMLGTSGCFHREMASEVRTTEQVLTPTGQTVEQTTEVQTERTESTNMP